MDIYERARCVAAATGQYKAIESFYAPTVEDDPLADIDPTTLTPELLAEINDLAHRQEDLCRRLTAARTPTT